MNNLIQAIKNSSKRILILMIVFFLGVLLSAYKLVMLPHDLLYSGNVANVSLATGVFVSLSLVIIATLLVGISVIALIIQVKKETIVFIEKKKTEEVLTESQSHESEIELLDVEAFKTALSATGAATFLQEALNRMCALVQAGQGAIYLTQTADGKREVELTCGFALAVAETSAARFEFGEGLIGQVALSGSSVYLDEVPEGYITIVSGLGTSYPRYLLILPLQADGIMKGVIELATFKPMAEAHRKQLQDMAHFLATRIN